MKKTQKPLSTGMNRRNFVKASALGLAGLGGRLPAGQATAVAEKKGDIPKIKGYRTLGRTGFRVSDIGIGTSRLAVVPLMKAAFEAGVNYIDTAEGYGRGEAERSIGQAIQGLDRKSLFITTKIRLNEVNNAEQVIAKVHQSLERLQTDYVDCMMIQGAATVESLKNDHFHRAMEQLKKEKKVRFLGTANHGSRFQGQGETMEKVLLGAIDDGRFDLVLLIYNFLQREAGEQILAAAAKKNIATTIMKSDPLGRYFETRERVEQMKKAGETPDENMTRNLAQMEEAAKQAESFIKEHNLQNPAEIKQAALKFVLNDPRVHTLNLAFTTFADLQNLLALSGTGLDAQGKKTLAEFEAGCGRLYCRHGCGACEQSCPYQVPVNTIMRYFNYFDIHGAERFAMEKYARLDTPKADLCRTCAGYCAGNCPYGVPIQGLLTFAHSRLALP